MTESAILERRLEVVEHAFADLQGRLGEPPRLGNWLEKVAGSISDESAFLEALEFGRSFVMQIALRTKAVSSREISAGYRPHHPRLADRGSPARCRSRVHGLPVVPPIAVASRPTPAVTDAVGSVWG